MEGNLEINITALETAADAVRDQFDFATIKRFYHLALLECAERMKPEDFERAIDVATGQLRRPA